MKRIDLTELEDLQSFPGWLRDPMTAYLKVVIDWTAPYDVVAPDIAAALRRAGLKEIDDLASGSGGPWPGLRDAIAREGVDVRVTLSDLYPSQRAVERFEAVEGVSYSASSASALDAPRDVKRMRTMFTGLHHFAPDDVRALLASAQEAGVPFLAAEATHRSLIGIVSSIFIPLLVLVLMPRVRPRKLLTLLLTYIVPVLPILIWWDGFASAMRTYRAEELSAMAAEIAVDGYEWEVREIPVKGAPIPVTRILGQPAQ